MTLLRRVIPLAMAALVLVSVAGARWDNALAVWEPRALALTFVVPWIALAASDSISTAKETFLGGFIQPPGGAPVDQVQLVRSRVRFLGGATMAAGVLAALFALIAEMNQVAATQGQMNPGIWPRFAAGMLLGPLYGLLLKVFLYDPVESALGARDLDLAELFD